MVLSGYSATFGFSKGGGMQPQEEMLEVKKQKKQLSIGLPKETAFYETRICLVPEAAGLLHNHGHRIIVETEAGKSASFQDKDYSDVGAEIALSKEDVFKADMILKVNPPTIDEIKLLQPNHILLSALQLTVQPENFLRRLMDKKITAIAYDYIMDETGIFPVIRAMGEIAGTTSILIAAEYLSNANDGPGYMLGGIPGVFPAEVVILGAGTVAEFAAMAALGLGATVKIFDNSIYKLARLQNLIGRRIYTSIIEPKLLKETLRTADVAVGALRAPFGRTPCVVSDDMVSCMKFGSVIVDVSIDQGGCFETSRVTNHASPVYKKYGVTHYCVPNIASRVSRTASYALSSIFAPILLGIGEEGGLESMMRKNSGVRNSVYLYKGILTNKLLGELFNLPYKDINLLMAAI
ncbi:MAG: alanine dehydrogenase [Bacteroidetes bacterium]|nr:alanine dehydrogenase [Bacteroidota bacterium]